METVSRAVGYWAVTEKLFIWNGSFCPPVEQISRATFGLRSGSLDVGTAARSGSR